MQALLGHDENYKIAVDKVPAWSHLHVHPKVAALPHYYDCVWLCLCSCIEEDAFSPAKICFVTQVAALTEVTLTQTAEIFRLNELVMQMDHELQQGNIEGGANLSHQLERSMSLWDDYKSTCVSWWKWAISRHEHCLDEFMKSAMSQLPCNIFERSDFWEFLKFAPSWLTVKWVLKRQWWVPHFSDSWK